MVEYVSKELDNNNNNKAKMNSIQSISVQKKPDGKFHVASKIWIFIIKFINSFYLSLLFVVFHIHHVYIGKEWERDSKERRIMMNFYFYFFCFRYYLQTMRLMIKIVSLCMCVCVWVLFAIITMMLMMMNNNSECL